ncbi:hypothetical protein [Burkholderia thailandensis]|uniref:hypothetical protein n=1 Tax=Burkholderia thailandensis TaxID=57975 RepID=UPI000FD653E6|nr:hypothetical protein [Burkholderia thailandensis]
MTRLKSLCIDAFLVLQAISLLNGCIALRRHELAAEWLGVVIASVSNLGFLFRLFAHGATRMPPRLWPSLVSTAIGASIAAWGTLASAPGSEWLPLFYGVLSLAGCLLYAVAQPLADRGS